MRTKRAFPQVDKRIFHPELKYYLECQSRLERRCTISQRTVITLSQVVRLIHCGYRCRRQSELPTGVILSGAKDLATQD